MPCTNDAAQLPTPTIANLISLIANLQRKFVLRVKSHINQHQL